MARPVLSAIDWRPYAPVVRPAVPDLTAPPYNPGGEIVHAGLPDSTGGTTAFGVGYRATASALPPSPFPSRLLQWPYTAAGPTPTETVVAVRVRAGSSSQFVAYRFAGETYDSGGAYSGQYTWSFDTAGDITTPTGSSGYVGKQSLGGGWWEVRMALPASQTLRLGYQGSVLPGTYAYYLDPLPDDGYSQWLTFAYPWDRVRTELRARAGSVIARAPSGEQAAWSTGTDEYLHATARYIEPYPGLDLGPVAGTWSDVLDFLEHAWAGYSFDVIPDVTNPSARVEAVLEEPQRGEAGFESDRTRTVDFVFRRVGAGTFPEW